ncbi:unnamed protein product [Rotaria socialis]|uniref:Uncharacterized protein n=1 Tax=Rotaria socialis TaxID=392032 RepID=A0A818C4R2_9BILA|nr:unnamed protein product [Rotaria socialis]CAF3418844.1 unnamed protein product [Rotaria socialis]
MSRRPSMQRNNMQKDAATQTSVETTTVNEPSGNPNIDFQYQFGAIKSCLDGFNWLCWLMGSYFAHR